MFECLFGSLEVPVVDFPKAFRCSSFTLTFWDDRMSPGGGWAQIPLCVTGEQRAEGRGQQKHIQFYGVQSVLGYDLEDSKVTGVTHFIV